MSKETREIACKIVTRWKADIGKVVKYERMIADIDKALRDEREQCAKAAKAFCDQFDKPSERFKEQLMGVIRNGVADAK